MANPYVNIPLIIEGQQSSTQQLNTVIAATNQAGNQAVEALNYVVTIPSQIINATYSKSGTIHTFVIGAFPVDENNVIITKMGIRATITANVASGDTFTLTDGTTTYTDIIPLTPSGEAYELEIGTVSPIIDFAVDIGGSDKHAFFKGGGAKIITGTITGSGGTSLTISNITKRPKAFYLYCTKSITQGSEHTMGVIVNNFHSNTQALDYWQIAYGNSRSWGNNSTYAQYSTISFSNSNIMISLNTSYTADFFSNQIYGYALIY